MNIKKMSTSFGTSDAKLSKLCREAEKRCYGNIADFGGRRVLVEGGGYSKIWLETQPMGGEMYAKRDTEIGLNNQLFFLENQRGDGKLPGSIARSADGVIAQYDKIQGFYLAWSALNMYYIIGRDREYLEALRNALERFDAYLWRVRDSDGDGCLESWCV